LVILQNKSHLKVILFAVNNYIGVGGRSVKQARNQPGMTGSWRFFWEGHKILKLCPTHFSVGVFLLCFP